MLTLALMAMTAGAAMAQNQDNKACNKDCANTEQCQAKKDCKKADCKKADCKKADCKKADCKKDDCKKACNDRFAREFEGIDLTAEQQEQINAIHAEQQAARQAKKEAAKAQKQAVKTDRQAERQAYLEKVKSVLTSEQYVKYLENQATRANKPMGRAQGKRFDKNAPRKVADRAPRAAKAVQVTEAQSAE